MWYSDKFSYSARHAGTNGYVVKFKRALWKGLSEKQVGNDLHYIARADPNQNNIKNKYLEVDGMTPVAMYKSDGTRII